MYLGEIRERAVFVFTLEAWFYFDPGTLFAGRIEIDHHTNTGHILDTFKQF